MRVFAHGAGGSGKTYVLSEVILKVYEQFLPACARRQAVQNSAARLILGETMHTRAGLKRGSNMTDEAPSKQTKQRLKQAWDGCAVVFHDEIGAAPPALYATLAARAYYGSECEEKDLPPGYEQAPFGDPLLHVDAGDFAQLRPVPKGSPSLMEALLLREEDCKNSERARPLTPLEVRGLRIFDMVARNTIEFQGTYRFRPNDPLIQLLTIMRTPGGASVPAALREQILSRVQIGSHDPRSLPSYRFPSRLLGGLYSEDNFSSGMYSAANWEQVCRLQQQHAMRNARVSTGVIALRNSAISGRPQLLWSTWCPYLNKTTWRLSDIVYRTLGRKLGPCGQLLYFIQRVDRPQLQQHASNFVLRLHSAPFLRYSE